MAFAAFVLSLAGFAALALSLARHHGDLVGHPPTRAVRGGLRSCGWMLLAASVVSSMAAAGVSIGIVLWFGLATVTTMAVALLLTCRAWWWRP